MALQVNLTMFAKVKAIAYAIGIGGGVILAVATAYFLVPILVICGVVFVAYFLIREHQEYTRQEKIKENIPNVVDINLNKEEKNNAN